MHILKKTNQQTAHAINGHAQISKPKYVQFDTKLIMYSLYCIDTYAYISNIYSYGTQNINKVK